MAVITVLEKEAEAVRMACGPVCDYKLPEVNRNDSNQYQLGQIFRKTPILLVSRKHNPVGTAYSSNIVTATLASFPSLRHVLLVGCAGGPGPLAPNIRRGDVVFATEIIEYDRGFKKEGQPLELKDKQLPKPSTAAVKVAMALKIALEGAPPVSNAAAPGGAAAAGAVDAKGTVAAAAAADNEGKPSFYQLLARITKNPAYEKPVGPDYMFPIEVKHTRTIPALELMYDIVPLFP